MNLKAIFLSSPFASHSLPFDDRWERGRRSLPVHLFNSRPAGGAV